MGADTRDSATYGDEFEDEDDDGNKVDGEPVAGSSSAPHCRSAASSASANSSTDEKRSSRMRAIPLRNTASPSAAGHDTWSVRDSGSPWTMADRVASGVSP